MRYMLFSIGLISLLGWAGNVSASGVEPVRPEVQLNVRQLQERNGCPGCNLAGADLSRGKFPGADLEGANLAGANLNLADLSGANLKNANLQGASFGGTDLAGADLSGANLTAAVIEGAYLAGAKMDGQVVVRNPYAEEGGPVTEEKVFEGDEGTSKNLPFTNTAMVSPEKIPDRGPVERETRQADIPAPVAADPAAEKQVDSMSDPMPKRSKQLSAMGDAVVLEKEPSGQAGTTVVATSLPAETGENPPAVQKLDAEAAMNTDRMPGKVVEEEEDNGQPAADVAAANEVSENPPQNEPEMKAGKEQAEIPAADPGEGKKQQLIEKLLDDNRCVACDLSGVDLSGKDLEGADLERVNLRGANLRETDLEDANLKGADLSGTDLRDADLRHADLYRANISGADLTGAKLEKALIDSLVSTDAVGADFTDAIGGR